ncbi:MAG: hypothetical protein M1819_003033 [Sarea resinae]|nr:MAG: hypothetical protein M1819_003033 [Sarea resinae]
MASYRGERFHIDLPSDDDEVEPSPAQSNTAASPPISLAFINDVQERPPSAARPPAAPSMKTSSTGFPAHKKRVRVSRFKQQRGSEPQGVDASSQIPSRSEASANGSTNANSKQSDKESFDRLDRKRIDEENNQRLAQMSAEEIEEERRELMSGLSPSLLELFLRKANIDDAPEDTGAPRENLEAPAAKDQQDQQPIQPKESKPKKSVTFDASPLSESPQRVQQPQIPSQSQSQIQPNSQPLFDPDNLQPSQPPSDLQPANSSTLPPLPNVHFPTAPQPAPNLDPNSPTFLTDLQAKYFPTLAPNPSSLSWLTTPPDNTSYSPSLPSLPPSSLRFSFTGALLPPSISLSLPANQGLHHHAEAPGAAGYTIPELAHLARSTVPAQRCMAYQMLGRILYRLGRGEWGEGDELVQGLWRCVEEGRVLDSLVEEAGGGGGASGKGTGVEEKEGRARGHVSAAAYAQEALWLWQKGGGRRWKAE